MMRLTAPNGSLFEVCDEAAERLLAAGWKRAEVSKKPVRKRTAKTKER